jgi:hypothetical protein
MHVTAIVIPAVISQPDALPQSAEIASMICLVTGEIEAPHHLLETVMIAKNEPRMRI